MSQKAKKAKPVQSRPGSPEASSGPPGQQETPDLSGNVREIDISRLSPRQVATLPALVAAPSIAQASRDTGVSERTFRRWLKDEDFRAQYSHLQKEFYDYSRKQFVALAPHFMSVLVKEAIENPDPSIRIRASHYGMGYVIKFCEVDRIADNQHDLKAVIRESQ